MSFVWVGLILAGLVVSIFTGTSDSIASALSHGATDAVTTVISLCGMMMLWCGVMEVMKECGLTEKLARLLRPILRRLFPSADSGTLGHLSSNVSANLLGLGNAATPAGIRAAEGLHRLSGSPYASDDLCMLTVINTSSLQLIPTTVAALRASAGAENPFDILPAVWISAVVSLTVGILCAKLFSRIGGAR